MEPNFGDYTQTKTNFGSKVVEFIQSVAIIGAIGLAIYLFIAQPHKVSGSSMLPTLLTGDYIITNKVGYRFSSPQKGQIIVFKNPRKETEDFIKRIIGIPGDKVKILNSKIIVNGKELEENYLDETIITNPRSFLKEGEEIIVPEGRYFVMGDNREASSDSREWGYITKEEIIGQALFRYWPITSFGVILAAQYINL